jgi:multidrug efflux pump subunit AcrA (membrane-fusion protein)
MHAIDRLAQLAVISGFANPMTRFLVITGLPSSAAARNANSRVWRLFWPCVSPCCYWVAVANASRPPQPAVGVRQAAMKGVNQSFEVVGRIKVVDKVEVRARVDGFLEKVRFREGQDVKAGDLLYQIEKVQFQAQVDQAEANLASADAEVTNARLQYDRQLELSRRQWSPQSVVDQNKAALDSGRAKVLQTQAALTQAKVNLDYADIRSPATSSIRRAGFWRRSSARTRSTCCFRSACATSRSSMKPGKGREAALPRSRSAFASPAAGSTRSQEWHPDRRVRR